jgi:predicted DNA-binding transcriptional regulator AlpA
MAAMSDIAVAPRVMSRKEAAAYVGLGVDAFNQEVQSGTFPAPLALARTRRAVWDRVALDKALDAQMGEAIDDWEVRKTAWKNRRQNRQKTAR